MSNYDRIRVTTTINPGVLDRLSKAALIALEQTAEAIKTDVMTAQVTPKDTSATEWSAHVDTAKIKKGLVKLTYDTPYARKIYWDPRIRFHTDKNPNARGQWLNAWIDGDKRDFAFKAYRKLYRREVGRALS